MLSEKPVAKDVTDAKDLIQFYEGLETKALWAVAENFRYTPSLVAAAERLKEVVGGRLTTFRLNMNGWVEEENKYFKTECEYFSLFGGGMWKGGTWYGG